MKYSRFILILVLIIVSGSCKKHQEAPKINISEEMVINESGTGTSFHWFDEQKEKDSLPVSRWETRGEEAFWPASIVIDLKGEFEITTIKIFDGKKTNFDGKNYRSQKGRLEIATGIPFQWEHLVSYELQNDDQWHTIPIHSKTGYLQLTKQYTQTLDEDIDKPHCCDLVINEVLIYGIQKSSSKSTDQNKKIKKESLNKYTFDEFMGTNAYKWTSLDLLAPVVGTVREYSHWFQNGIKNIKDSISWINIPTYGSFDQYYKTAFKKYSLDVVPDVHRQVSLELGEKKPNFGKNSLDPFSYKLIADYMFQMAARYGQTQVADSLLRVKSGNPVLSGAGWIRYFETWNEPERWWGDADNHFSPYEYAALASAAYDGHQGKMGKGFGIKQADPKARHLMAGISSLDFDFPRAVQFWSDHYRNGQMPFDVLNFHHYSNTSGFQHAGSETKGISPEADLFKERMEKAGQQRDKYFPDMEIWVTEFGWDTYEKSLQSATGHKLYPDGISMFELQGIWMVRAYLAGAAAGIDRLYMYMADDIKDPGFFHNCGLLTLDGKKKISWYYTATLKKVLTGTRFVKELDSGNKDILIYEFANQEKNVFVLWCPTSDGTHINDFPLKMDKMKMNNEVMVTSLADKHQNGLMKRLVIKDREIVVDVSESPVFITVKH